MQHHDLVNAVFLGVGRGGAPVVPQVQQVDLLKVPGQEGCQGIGVGVPDQQNPPCPLLIADDAQGLVAPQEGGVLVLLSQVFIVIQARFSRRAVPPGGDAQPPLDRKSVV